MAYLCLRLEILTLGKYSEPPSLYSQAASQVAPSPAGEGRGEENKIKAFLISPSSNLLPLERLSPRDKVRASEYLQLLSY